MITTISYTTHRRVNAPLEFNGLKGRYIFYGCAILVGSLLLFASLYIIGVSNWICLPLCAIGAAGGIAWVYRLSNRYGPYGWKKKQVGMQTPKALCYPSRRLFIDLAMSPG